MKKYLILLVIIFQTTYSQNSKKEKNSNAINFEFAGHSETIFSVNYERFFTKENRNLIYLLSIGIGVSPSTGDNENEENPPSTTTIPVVGGILYGKNHFAQIKFGYTPVFSKDFVDTSLNPNVVYKKFQSDFSLSIGYRFMPKKDGIVVQGYPIFIWSNNPTEKFKINFGVSLGYAF
jgi:hypothetical protein